MSISNLSYDPYRGASLLNSRPSFLRADEPPTLIRTLERYAGEIGQSVGEGSGTSRLFGSGAETPDYKALASAMLARLDAMRERVLERAAPDVQQRNVRSESSGAGWWHNGRLYTTAPAGTATQEPEGSQTAAHAPAVRSGSPPAGSSDPSPTASSTPPTQPAPAPAPTPSPTPSSSFKGIRSDSISLNDGATSLSDAYISGLMGVVGDNATNVSTLDLSNVVIRSTNYGIYLGSADAVRLSNVDIETSSGGGDSYSVRGSVRSFISNDSIFRSGIKAFRLYGVEGGSSTRDTFSGDRMMLGGGYANEWGNAAPFWNFTFADGSIDVNSVEIYNNTHHVSFENMDFAGTGHISIQAGAHDITFHNCTNLPQIRLYGTDGSWTTLPADPSRNIVVT